MCKSLTIGQAFFFCSGFTGRYFTTQLRDVTNMPLPLAW